MDELKAVSLFSNCGAGDIGYRSAGFQFEVVAELDSRRLDVCTLNHPGAERVDGDLRETWTLVIEKWRMRHGDISPDLLSACPPCQGMSSARGRRGNDDPDKDQDERNLLVLVIAKVVEALRPKLLVVENVPAFLTRKVRHPETKVVESAAKMLVEELRENYRVFPVLLDLCDFGVPQTRKRTFLTFVRTDMKWLAETDGSTYIPYPIPTSSDTHIKLKDALASYKLPSLDAASLDLARSDIGKGLHCVPVWSNQRYAMVSAIPPNSGSSAWDNTRCKNCGEIAEKIGKDDVVCPLCGEALLRPIVTGKDGVRLISGFRSSSYRRMDPNKPAATITTASGHLGSHFTIHPWENRLFSPLECAYLQTFPSNFEWGSALEKWGHSNVRHMIGEAVPPKFTEAHGKILMQLLCGTNDGELKTWMSWSDQRHLLARKKLKLSLT